MRDRFIFACFAIFGIWDEKQKSPRRSEKELESATYLVE
jgi:hypothetical protein